MCVAIPLKIIKIENGKAIVDDTNRTHRVNISLIKNPRVGDYLLVHGDLAINKVSQAEAEKVLALIKDHRY